MASSFEHTLRSLERQQRWRLWLLLALGLLGAWCAWLRCASVSVYASAPNARIEVSHTPSRVSSEADGRVSELHVELGARVERGALLAALDASVARAALGERLAEQRMLETKQRALEAQITAEKAKRASRLELASLAAARAAVGLERAKAVVERQAQLAEIERELWREQLTSKVDTVNADADLRVSRIELEGAARELERSAVEHEYEDKAELARIAELARQLSDLSAERTARAAGIKTAEAELARLSIIAPISGIVGSVAPLQVGDVIQPGQVIATIVPEDDVRVVAYFAPGPSVGRILPGQLARVRLEGFAWTQFGMLEATVAQIATEPRDGLIRVELDLDGEERWIPMQHGLTGSIDVQIERASPWALLQRSVGRNLTGTDGSAGRRAARLDRVEGQVQP